MPSLVTAAWSAWQAANMPLVAPDIERDLATAIVKLGVRVPPQARTAETLGIEREGTGVVIDDAGLILTIGYGAICKPRSPKIGPTSLIRGTSSPLPRTHASLRCLDWSLWA